MKKIIFKNFLRETTIFFLLSCSSVALIVWVIQAVNYLGFVTEDGQGVRVTMTPQQYGQFQRFQHQQQKSV